MNTPSPITDEMIERAADVRLVVADMDGTLLDDSGQLPSGFWEFLEELRERGIAFVPASGRQYPALTALFEPALEGMPIIAENGAYAARDGQEIHAITVDPSVAREAIIHARRAIGPRGAQLVSGKRSAYTDCTDPTFLREARKYNAKIEFLEDVLSFDDDVLKCAFFAYEGAESVILPHMERFSHGQHLAVAAPKWLDMMAEGVNKGVALASIQKALGVAPAQTVAFGDFLNDLELFDHAEFSFAMCSGHPEVISRARYVAPSNNESGVVVATKALLRIG